MTYCLYDRFSGPDCIAFTPDARRLACVYEDGTLVVFDLDVSDDSGAPHERVIGGFGSATAIAYSNDGRSLACGRPNGVVELRRSGLR